MTHLGSRACHESSPRSPGDATAAYGKWYRWRAWRLPTDQRDGAALSAAGPPSRDPASSNEAAVVGLAPLADRLPCPALAFTARCETNVPRRLRRTFDDSLATESADFSLVLGGPLFQLWQRSRLVGDALELLHRRIVAFVVVAWVPLLLLADANGL